MSVAILTIGDELLRGDLDNTNTTWLCASIDELGSSVAECVVVRDDVEAIAQCLLRLAQEHRVLVCTGGLGPTTDDVTSAAVAHALGVTLERDVRSVERIAERLRIAGRECSESNRKQADFPKGASVLDNDWGTAPGFAVDIGAARAFFLPGVPREMKPMFTRDVPEVITRSSPVRVASIRLKTFGAPESEVGDRLEGVERSFDVSIGYRARFPEIEVRPVARRESLVDARTAARLAADAIRLRLGPLVYAEGERGMPEVVADQLRARGYKLALAESCTGGLVSALMTAQPASDYFVGSVVCYDNSVKQRILGVDPQLLATEGAVSEPVVRQLAEAVRGVLGADVGVALSGIAGPSGGSAEKPVGLVHYAVSTPQHTVAQWEVFRGDRNRVQLRAAYAALNLARTLLG